MTSPYRKQAEVPKQSAAGVPKPWTRHDAAEFILCATYTLLFGVFALRWVRAGGIWPAVSTIVFALCALGRMWLWMRERSR